MPNIKIEIKNLSEIRSAFARSPRLMSRNLHKAIQKTLLTVGGQSRRNTPVATGRLRASTYERMYSGLKGEVGTNTNYDLFVHEGTRFMRARPFLRLAVESKQHTIDGYFGQAVQDTLNDIARRAR